MRRAKLGRAVAAGFFVVCGFLWSAGEVSGQSGAPPAVQTVAGGKLHGVVKSGATPLPGATVMALSPLGKRVSTATNLRGEWSLVLAHDGRYIVRTQFAGFAQKTQEIVLNAANRDQTINFDLLLASRAEAQEARELTREGAREGETPQTLQHLTGNGAQSLSLLNSLDASTEMQSGSSTQSEAGGAELPQVAISAEFGGDSVAISGRQGQVSQISGEDVDRFHDAMEAEQALQGNQQNRPNAEAQGGGFGGMGSMGGMGGFGGFGSFVGGGGGGNRGGRGGTGGGRGNFRNFNPSQPHGSFFWQGSNSALNAEPFSLRGQSQQQPASGTNRFGISFMTAPYVPGMKEPSGKDALFFTISGQRSSSPIDRYAIVPTEAERNGDFSASGQPKIYDPTTYQRFSYLGTDNVIPPSQITQAAKNLLSCSTPGCQPLFPSPNLAQSVNSYNYHLLSTQQSNVTQGGVRYMRALGKDVSIQNASRRGGSGRRSQNLGLRQSISVNYNGSHSAADSVNIYPQMGGKTWSNGYSVQPSYTLSYQRFTSTTSVNWNRSHSKTVNFFTGLEDIATNVGILGPGGTTLNSSPINYGLPNITLSSSTGLSELQPSDSVSQTISVSETMGWIHHRHNLRFGGNYRRTHRDFLGGSNSTGTFTFSGLFTENASGDSSTGSPVADLLLGLPQSTTINASASKNYLRDNVFSLYAMDDWRILRTLTLNFGLRYEYFAPYTEKFGRMAMVDTDAATGFTSQSEIESGGTSATHGKLPPGLIFPYHKAFSPRVSLAWRVPRIHQMVLRAGYGMNYSVGQYSGFASSMARQPLPSQAKFVNQQTNLAVDANGNASSACAQTGTCFTLASGFGAPNTIGNFSIDPHYPLPYVQAWNVNLQKTLPWEIVLNAGYNGAKGNNQGTKIAPRATTDSPNTNPTNQVFSYAEAGAFTRHHAGTLSVQKRLTSGVSMRVFYQYAHSIDNAASLAQNWQDIQSEESNSSFDVRHSVNGSYLFELPFGQDKRWINTGKFAHILEGFSVSGSFKFATGNPLSPSYRAAVADVARGTSGTLRPDRVEGESLTAGGGSLKKWFNTAAFQKPAGTYGTASRYSIPGPGTVSNSMALSKTVQTGATSSWEFRASANNVFNTVQYAGVDATVNSKTFGQVTSASSMRSFNFQSRFRF